MKASGAAAACDDQKPLPPHGDLPKAWALSVCGQLKRPNLIFCECEGHRRKADRNGNIFLPRERSSTESRFDRQCGFPFKIQAGFQL
jgi:hypothetical protein